MLLRAVVAATLAHECLADVAVDVDRLACARVFLDVEPEHHLAVLLEAVLRNVDIVVHLPPGVHDREEVVLHFVGLVHAADFEMLAVLRDADDDPAPARIGERGGRFEDGLRQRVFGGFELGVASLAGAVGVAAPAEARIGDFEREHQRAWTLWDAFTTIQLCSRFPTRQ
ncbi:MAG: hypothetical protein BWY17_03408 [Deltaproteobacteria bacterium ADurb.Bin207]|nr:MAG: hypothetical protein BWY17_03408 [Deltaproteobacteria bacterium ADurb.Bin207]